MGEEEGGAGGYRIRPYGPGKNLAMMCRGAFHMRPWDLALPQISCGRAVLAPTRALDDRALVGQSAQTTAGQRPYSLQIRSVAHALPRSATKPGNKK